MLKLLVFLTALLLAGPVGAASSRAPEELRDLYFGEALYWAFQEEWFSAIARLDTELQQFRALDQPELDPFHWHSHQAEFAVGDFELAYRMHHRAGRAITAVIEGNVDPEVRNEAIFRLAKIHYQKDQPQKALLALETINGPVPSGLVEDLQFLRGQVLMANGRDREAIGILLPLKDSDRLRGFAGYNLGMALIRNGEESAGHRELDFAGQLKSDDPLTVSVRDKANLMLGEKLLAAEQFSAAEAAFDRIRLEGPFSGRALLGAGWAAASRQDYRRALVPWTLLAEREVTDAAVQEALLGVPYSYGKLGVYSKAALLYGHALEVFNGEVSKLSASITAVRDGSFLDALLREELKLDSNWVVRLRELPDTPETYYLLDLLASHDFQESLKNYLDLEQLRKRLRTWERDLRSFSELIEQRRAYYGPLLPEIDRSFRQLDSRMRLRLEQRAHIEKKLQAMLVAPQPELLKTAAERRDGEKLARLESSWKKASQPAGAETGDRLKRLRGLLDWNIHTDYQRRFAVTYQHLEELDKDVAYLQQRYDSFVRIRQAATQSYQGYAEPLQTLQARIRNAVEQVTVLMSRQGHLLETMAEQELVSRRERLEEFQIKARFAMADSYDRAARNHSVEQEER